MNPSLKEEKVEDRTPIGWKCSLDGIHYYGYAHKRCRYCVPVYSKTEFEKLERRD